MKVTGISAGVASGVVSYEKAHLSHTGHLNSIYKAEKEHFPHSPN